MTEERRAHPRRQPARPYPVRVLSPEGRVLCQAVLEDASRCGVRLLASRAFPEGYHLALEPAAPHPLAGQRFAFQVQRCEGAGGGGFRLAGPFLALLPPADLEALAGSEGG